MTIFCALRLVFAMVVVVATPAIAAAAEGEMRWGLHVTLAPKWLAPFEDLKLKK